MNDEMKTKMLEKLMDFLSQLPDKEDSKDGAQDGAMDGALGLDGKPKVEMLSIDAKPMDDDDSALDKLKGC